MNCIGRARTAHRRILHKRSLPLSTNVLVCGKYVEQVLIWLRRPPLSSDRRFLQLIADPAYAEVETYKLMAPGIDLGLVSSDKVIPDLR